MIDRSQRDWYKDAVIYQVHVKSFFDSDNDGVGDFEGLRRKLDYIQELGATAIWLMPFYKSPLRDDGYDIADYKSINPSYGSLGDFKRFLRDAHNRGLRVITELVINHTSDQHPWFQRARQARPGSVYRNYYVWSDTDQKYQGTRIIFLDTERSNWTWDPVAKAYFWHRFYSHQPDLNYDNPSVLREVINVLRFWLQMGVDGLRLDAVPYLCEREGTNNENLPETHAVLKRIRAEVDAEFPDRMLLAEANQWPEDAQEYFGKGDECHMAFHFPLMPRMYMGIAQEDRYPITDIMRQTPEIPESCQWAIFLRNHDELTLEMVTEEERDYLWRFYAADSRMRINLGIRRRLAPLMGNDRRKIELMNGLLMSMPGTPVIYYGDEIGMGDNIYLGDRDGVRTPMQWTPDRNGGFSRSDPAKLFLPPIMDPIYGYEALNVEAQSRSPASMLNWMRSLIGVRQQHPAFSRGELHFLYPGNRKVLAYLRVFRDDTILCLANLSGTAQSVELDLSERKHRIPVELFGGTVFPPIGDLPYLLTLPPYGFLWFTLAEEATIPHWHESIPEPMPDLRTLVMRTNLEDALHGRQGDVFAEEVLPLYLPNQRWFAAKNRRISSIRIDTLGTLPRDKGRDFVILRAHLKLEDEGEQHTYLLPLAISWEPGAASLSSALLPYTLAKIRKGPRIGAIYDALSDGSFALGAVEAMRDNISVRTGENELRFRGTAKLGGFAIPEAGKISRVAGEQSNSSVNLDNRAILKVFRQIKNGPHPELEMTRFITEAGFANVPALLGWIEAQTSEGSVALAVLQEFVQNQGDGWTRYADELQRLLYAQVVAKHGELPPEEEPQIRLTASLRTLGQRLGELHQLLAQPTGEADFQAEPITRSDLLALAEGGQKLADAAFRALSRVPLDDQGDLAAAVQRLLAERSRCLDLIEAVTAVKHPGIKMRVHGDLHLGQVLLSEDDFYIVDFEGEPARTIEERRAKSSPFKDVAGMLRSFDYLAWTAAITAAERGMAGLEELLTLAMRWRDRAGRDFLRGYASALSGSMAYITDRPSRRALQRFFCLEKALYEVTYEAANRPRWLRIPVSGVLSIIERANQGSSPGDQQ